MNLVWRLGFSVGLLALTLAHGCGSVAFERTGPQRSKPAAIPALRGSAGALARVADEAEPSLVRVRTETGFVKSGPTYAYGLGQVALGSIDPTPLLEWPIRLISLPAYLLAGWLDVPAREGAGFFVSDDQIVSNAHVVDNGVDIVCETTAGLRFRATVEAIDLERDLALLRVVPPGAPEPPLPELPGLGLRVEPPVLAEPVVALGFPAGAPHPAYPFWSGDDEAEPHPTVTAGIVSATRFEAGNPATAYVQVDAALNHGNSGGPVLGLDGAVIGVATWINRRQGAEAQGYLVPAAAIREAFGPLLRAPTGDRE